jgi:mannose-6-phosphate isomerase-like protein (cupin superfamily)
MTPSITTLDPITTSVTTKTILAKEGFACSLLTLAPGDETPRRETDQIEDHVLLVIEGEVTIRYGDVNTMLGKDQAILMRKGEPHVIAASPGGWTKLLRVDIPPRQLVTPQIITPGQ